MSLRFALRSSRRSPTSSLSWPSDVKPYGKLVVGPRTEVYNLREDPNETYNLTPDRPKKTTRLTNALHAWLKRTRANFPTMNPDFDEKRWWTSGVEK